MTLDMLKVSPELVAMAREEVDRAAQRRAQRNEAHAVLLARSDEWEDLATFAASSKGRFARPLEPLNTHAGLTTPLPPRGYLVIATDGSQIEPDHHELDECFLLNVGWAVVRYGAEPTADLASDPTLFFGPDTYFVDGERRIPIRGDYLASKRSVEELRKAADLAGHWADRHDSVLVLGDGTLRLWVGNRPDDVVRDELVSAYVDELKRIRDAGVPLASYISRPRSPEVRQLLQFDGCHGGSRPCSACGSITPDACIFERLVDREIVHHLEVGERSALFEMTLRPGLATFYKDLTPRFFYLNVGSEIGRVEVPPWTAEDPEALNLVQAVVLDQCQKGLGYPNVLARAHEQAIVTGQDRLTFRYLVDAIFAREGVPPRVSEKLYSKRVRAV